MVTIRAVAKAAGVSTTTVSFVLNDTHPHVDGISEETRERVKECASRLGYRRNPAAAFLRTGRSAWIGVAVQAVRNETDAHMWAPYELSLLFGVQNALLENGYFAVLGAKSTTGSTENLDALAASGVGGLIYRRPLRQESGRLRELIDRGTPAIAVFPARRDEIFPYCIDVDNTGAGGLAAELLLDANRGDLMCVSNEDARYTEVERLDGFRTVVEAKTGSEPMTCMIPVSFDDSQKVNALAECIQRNKPNAILAPDAGLAYLISLAVAKLKLKMPDDISLIGFDCWSFNSAREQRLSSVGTSWWRAGRAAALSIIDMVCNGTKWTEPMTLEPVFIPGDSTPRELAGRGEVDWVL